MNRIIREQRDVVVRRWDPAAKNFKTIKTCKVELVVDMDGLFSLLGQSAAQSKGGKSVDALGHVMARVVR